jgi:hypothetical protein
MKPVWIVEKHMFPEYENELVAAIERSGASCYLFDDTDFIRFNFDRDIKNKFTDKDCVIFYGSLQRGRELYTKTNFVPGIFLNINNYECYKYYGMFGNSLLNSTYYMMGLNDLKRWEPYFYYQFHNNEDKIFIRPSNGYKTFPGQIINMNNFDQEYETLISSYGGLDMDQLILISPYQKILKESRFLVVGGKVVDGCVYMIDGVKTEERIVDEEALVYSNIVVEKLKKDYPDEAYTLDIALNENGQYKVLEINSFCCASIYHMDIDLVVNAINDKCEECYDDFWDCRDTYKM